jgi:carbon storage regulator CsrA
MLVLSRRPEEKIVFPSLGVTIQVLRIQGNAVRIGVEAPPDVRVLRHELEVRPARERADGPTPPGHARGEQWNKVNLLLYLLERQLRDGDTDAASATLADALAQLESMDPAWVAA